MAGHISKDHMLVVEIRHCTKVVDVGIRIARLKWQWAEEHTAQNAGQRQSTRPMVERRRLRSWKPMDETPEGTIRMAY